MLGGQSCTAHEGQAQPPSTSLRMPRSPYITVFSGSLIQPSGLKISELPVFGLWLSLFCSILFPRALHLGEALWAVIWMAPGLLVPRAGVFLTFGQLAGNGLPLTRMTVCLPHEFSSLHGNNLAGEVLKAHSIVRFTRASIRCSVLIGGSWGFCGFLQLKQKKLISHVQDWGVRFPFTYGKVS